YHLQLITDIPWLSLIYFVQIQSCPILIYKPGYNSVNECINPFRSIPPMLTILNQLSFTWIDVMLCDNRAISGFSYTKTSVVGGLNINRFCSMERSKRNAVSIRSVPNNVVLANGSCYTRCILIVGVVADIWRDWSQVLLLMAEHLDRSLFCCIMNFIITRTIQPGPSGFIPGIKPII